ncbi:amino acid ABC transporter amino acid-binding protein YxeM [Gottschalkia acidurici 9a]|uniref:Amino acid ABC transporter amino acid-binding protein YxeM n=1 Tax=Gottschalkia acidurici (strain ATCC 7906 / DSM 604 / BCRC 14475 / CIP 104303 / KCTC 5404 / NCIMB 10678 / 9a) TaxID=1128398 RepID=K0B0J6_GOTA9|nr:transporter substrate-binding domain-containing protein [Gottschalkia acidurici]AFS79563.1 amino acid ABC transporter amino acid-binding protein YxeM [Gottschalkia acidurici 9a]
MKLNKRGILLIALTLIISTLLLACQSDNKVEQSSKNIEKTDNNKNDEANKSDLKKNIIVGTSASYYPWAFQKDNELHGFEIDIWNEIATRNDYSIGFQISKFSGLVGMLDAGQITTIAHQMSITDDRLEKYYFSEPYAYSYYDFAVKKDSSLKTIEDLKGKTVGCWLGGNGEKTIRDINEKEKLNLNIKTYDGVPIESEVALGRLDASWQGEIKTLSTIEEGNLNLKMMGIKPFYEINAYPFLKNDDSKKLQEEISKTIKEMHEDGTLKKLSEKWFSIDTTTKPIN